MIMTAAFSRPIVMLVRCLVGNRWFLLLCRAGCCRRSEVGEIWVLKASAWRKPVNINHVHPVTFVCGMDMPGYVCARCVGMFDSPGDVCHTF